MWRRVQILFNFCFAIFVACDSNSDFFKDTGRPETLIKNLDSFQSITVGEKFYVEIECDLNKPQNITIEYYQNLNPKIDISVSQGKLYIKDLNDYNWTRDLNIIPKLKINAHHLNELNIKGSCEFKCIDTIKTNILTINMESALPANLKVDCGNLYGGSNNIGSIYFEGRGTIFSWSCEMGSSVDARRLKCDDAYIRHYTKKDIYLSPDKIFDGFLYNSGNLFLKDKNFNKYNSTEKGTGRIIKY